MNPRERAFAPELSHPVKLLSGALLLSFILLTVTAALVWKSHNAYENYVRSEVETARESVSSPGAMKGGETAQVADPAERREAVQPSSTAAEPLTEQPSGTAAERTEQPSGTAAERTEQPSSTAAERESTHRRPDAQPPSVSPANTTAVKQPAREQTRNRVSASRTLFAGVLVLGIFLLIAAVSSGLFAQLSGYISARRRAVCACCTRSVHPSVYAQDCKFRILVERSLTGIFVLQDGRFVYVNPRFAEVFGYPADEVIGAERLTDLVMPEESSGTLHFDDASGDRKRSSNAARSSSHYTVRKLRKDGSTVYAEVFCSELEYDGRPAVIGTVLDVTERHEAQEKLRVMGMAVEQSSEGVLVVDTFGIVSFVNPAWARMHGYEAGEVTGRHFRIFHTKDQLRRDVFPVINRFENTSVYRAEMGHLRKDGSTFMSSTAFATLRGRDGSVMGAVGICRDITEQKTYEAELLAAKEAAEELSRLRTAFLTNMSHEIRTPLTGILGFARVLEDEVREDQSEFVRLIRISADRLLNTLNSILRMARLQAGEMSIQPEDVDLADEIGDIAVAFHGMAREKRLDFHLNLPPSPFPARIDRTVFGIILKNLIGNAVKFTSEGGVIVHVRADEDHVQIKVTDTGVGIDEAFLPYLFDEFKQESDGLTRTHEGSGLGLAVTKRLVDLLGGVLQVESAKGVGTHLRLRLPRYTDSAALSKVA